MKKRFLIILEKGVTTEQGKLLLRDLKDKSKQYLLTHNMIKEIIEL